MALYCVKPSRLALPIVGVTGICHRPLKESPLRTTLTATVSSKPRFSAPHPHPTNAIVMLPPAKRADAGPATSQPDFSSFFSNSALCFQLLHHRSLFIYLPQRLTVHSWSGSVWARASWRQRWRMQMITIPSQSLLRFESLYGQFQGTFMPFTRLRPSPLSSSSKHLFTQRHFAILP